MPEPVEVFELTGTSAIRRRLQAAAARGLTRFVGRQHELAVRRRRWRRQAPVMARWWRWSGTLAWASPAWCMSLSTPTTPRLAGPRERLGVLWQGYALFPRDRPAQALRPCRRSDDTRTVRAKVTGQVLTLDETLQDTVPALLALLDALPDDSPFRSLDPPQRRQRTLDGLKRLLLRESQVQPLLLVFEDLHWIDSETQALLDSLVESLPTAYLLLLVNYRPEYQHGWGSKTYYTQLRLDPLLPVSAEEFSPALLGDAPSLAPLTRLLRERTGGNPFFLEESVRTLVEAGVLLGERRSLSPGAAPRHRSSCRRRYRRCWRRASTGCPPEAKHLLQTAAVDWHRGAP